MLSEAYRKLIHENKNIHINKLADFLGLPLHIVRRELEKTNRSWSYSGCNIPFCRFSKSPMGFVVYYKSKRLFTGNLNSASNFVTHLIWCIENKMFDAPRIESPYLMNLKLGE